MVSRSKSSPQLLDDFIPIATGRFARPGRLSRSQTSQSLNTPTSTPLATPWEAREDPFSLLRFFPSCPAESQVDWDWIHMREVESEDEDEDNSSAHQDLLALSISGEHKQEHNYDEFVRQVIDGEDKYGMLAFSSENFPSLLQSKVQMSERPISPVHVSSLVVDEPLDLDALHSQHCSRRETILEGEAEQGEKIGQLFFSGEEETREARLSWTEIIFEQLLSFVVNGEQGA